MFALPYLLCMCVCAQVFALYSCVCARFKYNCAQRFRAPQTLMQSYLPLISIKAVGKRVHEHTHKHMYAHT